MPRGCALGLGFLTHMFWQRSLITSAFWIPKVISLSMNIAGLETVIGFLPFSPAKSQSGKGGYGIGKPWVMSAADGTRITLV